jgi:hypothetical protein
MVATMMRLTMEGASENLCYLPIWDTIVLAIRRA